MLCRGVHPVVIESGPHKGMLEGDVGDRPGKAVAVAKELGFASGGDGVVVVCETTDHKGALRKGARTIHLGTVKGNV